jgi:hypothetical protein
MKGVSSNATILKDYDGEKYDFKTKRTIHEEGLPEDKLKNNLKYAYTRLVNNIPIHIIQSTFEKTGIDGYKFQKNGVGIRMTYPIKKIS